MTADRHHLRLKLITAFLAEARSTAVEPVPRMDPREADQYLARCLFSIARQHRPAREPVLDTCA